MLLTSSTGRENLLAPPLLIILKKEWKANPESEMGKEEENLRMEDL